MSDHCRYFEDLPSIAAQAYALAGRFCGGCGDQHALWTYLRLARASTGAEGRDSALALKLHQLAAAGLRDVLIAGAQDTGLLALVARATADEFSNIVVLDKCQTPLALCDKLAAAWSLPIQTIKEDLLNLKLEQRFDVVLIHGTLNFIVAERQAEVLGRVRRAMRAHGRLVLQFNTGRPLTVDRANENHVEYADFILSELKRINVPLPDREEVMHERLVARARRRELRDVQFANADDVVALVGGAGFRVLSCTPASTDMAKPADALLAQFAKRRFTLIAEPLP